MNTTEPYTGRRRIIAPFRFPTGQEQHETDLRFFPLSKDSDVPLSTAASLSARFPWASPSGWFNETFIDDDGKPAVHKVRLVDGGYVDNSGIATALDLIKVLNEGMEQQKERFSTLPKLEIQLISLMTGGLTEGTFHGLGEGLGPLQAMFSSRSARAYTAIAQAEQQLRRSVDAASVALSTDCRNTASAPSQGRTGTRLHRISVESDFYDLPLGWRLSSMTWYLVRRQSGDPFDCRQDEALQCKILKSRSRPDGDCVQNTILRQLTDHPGALRTPR